MIIYALHFNIPVIRSTQSKKEILMNEVVADHPVNGEANTLQLIDFMWSINQQVFLPIIHNKNFIYIKKIDFITGVDLRVSIKLANDTLYKNT